MPAEIPSDGSSAMKVLPRNRPSRWSRFRTGVLKMISAVLLVNSRMAATFTMAVTISRLKPEKMQ